MRCHLLVPGLPFPLRPGEENPLARLSLPALQTLLARSRREQDPATTGEEWLCRAFEVEKKQGWPIASLTLLADGGTPEDGYWLRADPVHLALRRDRMILADSGAFPLSPPEARMLADTLNRHFAADGLGFLAPHPARWYLRLPAPADMQTTSLPEAAGRGVRTLLPRGKDAMRWHGILTEIQMLLHSHPVNEAREARGELPVNSVWLWGGGSLPDHIGRPFDKVWADDPLARGLALASGGNAMELPSDAETWLGAAGTGEHLMVLDHLRSAAQYDDLAAWEEKIRNLERQWFAPLKRAVQAGKLTLALHFPASSGTRSFAASRADLWKIWRRPKPWTEYFQP